MGNISYLAEKVEATADEAACLALNLLSSILEHYPALQRSQRVRIACYPFFNVNSII